MMNHLPNLAPNMRREMLRQMRTIPRFAERAPADYLPRDWQPR